MSLNRSICPWIEVSGENVVVLLAVMAFPNPYITPIPFKQFRKTKQKKLKNACSKQTKKTFIYCTFCCFHGVWHLICTDWWNIIIIIPFKDYFHTRLYFHWNKENKFLQEQLNQTDLPPQNHDFKLTWVIF